ncbi:iron-sulfur cluster assembly scaffold protein [Novosphingobium pokkalii]|uniref:iron-sulfur cluster assembly scaffold protein n=1 Tax=Novosphingobium pokkalii TaxID=1770194 RepID=UPI00362957BA
MSATVLYTPEVLAAAMSLAQHPWDESLPRVGSARSRACGSTLDIGLSLDAEGRIVRLGLRPHACAVGQAAAQVFAEAAIGRTLPDLQTARAALGAWLAGEGVNPIGPASPCCAGRGTIPAAMAPSSWHGMLRWPRWRSRPRQAKPVPTRQGRGICTP